MFIDASSRPTASPKTASEIPSPAFPSPAPTPSSVSSTTGWDQQRPAGRHALDGPLGRHTADAGEDRHRGQEHRQQRVGDAAPVLDGGDARHEQCKATPCARKPNASEALPCRRASVMAASVSPEAIGG
jgi:hypothetical protein